MGEKWKVKGEVGRECERIMGCLKLMVECRGAAWDQRVDLVFWDGERWEKEMEGRFVIREG